MNQLVTLRSLILGLSFSLFLTSPAARAGCSGTQATFDLNGTVCLPTVQVNLSSGTVYYQIQLQLSGSSQLKVTSLQPASPSSQEYIPTFNNGALDVPRIEQYDTFGTNRYHVQLNLIPNTNPISFALAGITPVGDYTPGVTWKPYVMLQANEKAAINALGKGQGYTELAIAAYDFSIQSTGAWQLQQNTSTASGMQAGVYVNQQNNTVAIAFRGTEICVNPLICSVDEIKQSTLDTSADALLTQGKDSGQFNDAYKFAQKVASQYAGRKIVMTGHSLGGALAQAAGAALKLETYAFNAAPVPDEFISAHQLRPQSSQYRNLIFVIADVHDPVSNLDSLGDSYSKAQYQSAPIFFDFERKEIAPDSSTSLADFRFDQHTMSKLRDNIADVMGVYQQGW